MKNTTKETKFLKELEAIINSNSFENRSETPDFILAEYLFGCLKAFENLQVQKNKWYGTQQRISDDGGDLPKETIKFKGE